MADAAIGVCHMAVSPHELENEGEGKEDKGQEKGGEPGTLVAVSSPPSKFRDSMLKPCPAIHISFLPTMNL